MGLPLNNFPVLVLATQNQDKARELTSLLQECPYEFQSLTDHNIVLNIEETGSTLEENAVLKARKYMELAGLPCLSDDSGLEVDCLGGEPGVHTKRYGGLENASDQSKNDYLLSKLRESQSADWSAKYVSVISIAWPNGTIMTYKGECYGKIISRCKGEFGFGYDPIFYLPRLGKTMAELSLEQKNLISHRGIAARKAIEGLKNLAQSLRKI